MFLESIAYILRFKAAYTQDTSTVIPTRTHTHTRNQRTQSREHVCRTRERANHNIALTLTKATNDNAQDKVERPRRLIQALARDDRQTLTQNDATGREDMRQTRHEGE